MPTSSALRDRGASSPAPGAASAARWPPGWSPRAPASWSTTSTPRPARRSPPRSARTAVPGDCAGDAAACGPWSRRPGRPSAASTSTWPTPASTAPWAPPAGDQPGDPRRGLGTDARRQRDGPRPGRACPGARAGWPTAGGRFVVTSSAAGLLTMIGSAPYSVTKHASVAFAEWLSITYGDRGVMVQAICPQGVRTRMLDASGPLQDLLSRDQALAPARGRRRLGGVPGRGPVPGPAAPRGRRLLRHPGRPDPTGGWPGCAACRARLDEREGPRMSAATCPASTWTAFTRWYAEQRPGDLDPARPARRPGLAGGKSNLTYAVTDGTAPLGGAPPAAGPRAGHRARHGPRVHRDERAGRHRRPGAARPSRCARTPRSSGRRSTSWSASRARPTARADQLAALGPERTRAVGWPMVDVARRAARGRPRRGRARRLRPPATASWRARSAAGAGSSRARAAATCPTPTSCTAGCAAPCPSRGRRRRRSCTATTGWTTCC